MLHTVRPFPVFLVFHCCCNLVAIVCHSFRRSSFSFVTFQTSVELLCAGVLEDVGETSDLTVEASS